MPRKRKIIKTGLRVDERWVDVDFEDEPQYIRGDLELPAKFLESQKCYEDVYGATPESRWKEEIAENDARQAWSYDYVSWIRHQVMGSCVSQAAATAHEVMQARQYGLRNVVKLGAISLYKRIGRSPNSGAMVSDGLREMKSRGILPLNNAANKAAFGEHVFQNKGGFYDDMPHDWESTAKKFRIESALVIRSMGGYISALIAGFPVCVGRNGHSICQLAARMVNGRISTIYVNSWAKSWGQGFGKFDGGFGVDTMRAVESSARWCYAVTSVTSPYLAMRKKVEK